MFSQSWWSSKKNIFVFASKYCCYYPAFIRYRMKWTISFMFRDNLCYRKSNLHVFSQWAGMSVWFIAAYDFTVVRFVAGVDMWMLLSVWWVSESSLTSVVLTFKRLLSWKINKNIILIWSCSINRLNKVNNKRIKQIVLAFLSLKINFEYKKNM